MRFKDPGLELEFKFKLHPKVRDVVTRFDRFCIGMDYGHAILTDISRTPDFYEKRALEAPSFSWHFIDCAVDMRNWHLTPEKREACEVWLQEQCPGSQWQFLKEKHGTAEHWHLAFKDYSLRREFSLTAPPTLKKRGST